MERLFVSLPMNGLSDDQIKDNILILAEKAEKTFGQEFELIDSFIEEDPPEDVTNIPLWYLAKSLELLATADAVIFGKGWKEARGCKLEHDAAQAYGIEHIILMS